MRIIGVTGGSGSGKSTLLQAARARGALVIDCDEIYHALLATSAQMRDEISARFPGTVEHGVLARKKLGKLVFDDPQALQDLNAITHAYVLAEVQKRLDQAQAELAVIDAIGLLESGLGELCAATIAVTAPEDVRVERLMKREGVSEAYARARIRAQKPDAYYTARCTHTLYNDYPTCEAFTCAAAALLDEIEKWQVTAS